MVKFNEETCGFFYYDENDIHQLRLCLNNMEAAKIINDLLLNNVFRIDQTILSALYMGMRKLQGYTDDEIKKLCR